MRWDKQKLQLLNEDLTKIVNQSIYRNALPINIERLDLANASLSEAFSTQFVKQLLGNSHLDAEVQSSDDFAYKFHHLYIEHKNQLEDKGIHDLGFGYPMFIHKQEHSLSPVAAPLFIWDMELSHSPYRPNNWTLSRKKQSKIRPNRFLIQYIKETFNIDLKVEMEELLESGMNGGKLSAFCNHISLKLDIGGNTSSYGIVKCPNQEDLAELEEMANIRFSGVLGNYGQDHQYLSTYINEKVEYLEDNHSLLEDPVPNNYQHPFSLVKPDPSQKNMGQNVVQKSMTLAEGGPGTGKTMAAIHAATHALANGNTSIIISPNISSLEKIQQFLNEKQVGALAYLFKKGITDLDAFYHALKLNANKKAKKTDKEQELGFKILMERVQRKHDRIADHHQLMNQQAFGSFDFTDTVGHYIESSRNAGKDILSGKLSARNYKFTFREYDILKTDISVAEKLYADVRRMKHPLEDLHEEIFLEKEAIKGEAFTAEQLIHFKAKTEQLLARFTDGLESYRDNLRDHYEDHARELNGKYQEIQHKINEYAQVFGEDFKKSSSTKVKMYGVFSDTYFNIKEARNEINADFRELEELFNEKRYFDYKFPDKRSVDTIQNIQQNLEDFGLTMQGWVNGIPGGILQETDSLNSKSVQIQLDYKSRIGELEYQHDLLLEELNQSKLFKEWFAYDGMTLNKRLESLETLWNKLDRMQRHLADFQKYHPWQKHWLELLPVTRDTITALSKSHANSWVDAFNSWYFYNCLSDRSFLSASVNDDFRNDYINELSRFRQEMPQFINRKWEGRRTIALENLKKRDKKLYQIIASKKAVLPVKIQLKDLFETCKDEIPALFPIMLMTPDVAEELLIHSKISFDLVIFDDAHHIPTVQAIPLTDKSERVLAIGDRRQSIDNHGRMLMDTLIESGSSVTPLYYNHIENERSSYEFINNTTYNKGIKKINYFTSPYTKKGIILQPSEGTRYDEDDQSNPLEAEHLVRVLAETSLGENNRLPKTAIVANTLSQRDHISAYFLYLKQKRNPYSDRIIKLEEAGMRVLHISELKHHYDTIVWSMTFGKTNLKGTISADFERMERTFGQSALNIILGHTKERLIVCSSIPEAYVAKVSEDENSAGPVVKFLKYASLCSAGNEKKRIEYMKSIEWPGIKRDDYDMNKFMAQVKKELEPYFEQDRIKLLSPLSEIGTAAITIMPLDYKQAIPLVIGDAIDRNIPSVASEYEKSVYENLKEAGYKIFKTNSLDWWKNPKREARMLASRLIKADNTPAELQKISD